MIHKKQFLKILWSEVWKGGISIDANSAPWCCGSICHRVFTFILAILWSLVCRISDYVKGDSGTVDTRHLPMMWPWLFIQIGLFRSQTSHVQATTYRMAYALLSSVSFPFLSAKKYECKKQSYRITKITAFSYQSLYYLL